MSDEQRDIRADLARELERLGVLQREYFAAEQAHREQCEKVYRLDAAVRSLNVAERTPAHAR